MHRQTLPNRSAAQSEPTLFDLPIKPRPARPAEASGGSRPAVRPLPKRLSPADDHPDAGQRFDVFFTHEQMVALNAAVLLAYEKWGVRINKSQLLRALVGALESARPELKELIETSPACPLPSAPAKAADADVHRRFESKLSALLTSAIRHGESLPPDQR